MICDKDVGYPEDAIQFTYKNVQAGETGFANGKGASDAT